MNGMVSKALTLFPSNLCATLVQIGTLTLGKLAIKFPHLNVQEPRASCIPRSLVLTPRPSRSIKLISSASSEYWWLS